MASEAEPKPSEDSDPTRGAQGPEGFAVVDDYSDREAWRERAADGFSRGLPPDELIADLVAGGWERAEAEELVELVRRQTRDERGVTTRDSVARLAKGDGRTSPLGFFGMGTIAHFFKLRESFARLAKLGTRRSQPEENAPDDASPGGSAGRRSS